VDYTIEFARVLRSSSPDATFSFLSGNGADPTGRTRLAFARYKGEAEKALLATGFPRVYIFRPAYIYPVEPRKEPNFSYRLMRAIYPAFRVLFPNQMIRADDLAGAMVDVVARGAVERRSLVLENRDIRAMVESLHHSTMGAQLRSAQHQLRYTCPGKTPPHPDPRASPRVRSSPQSLHAEPLSAWGERC